MCPAWHNEEWPDDECDDPAHGCHQVAAYRREQLAKDPNWQDPICGAPGEPGVPGEGPRLTTWSGNPARPASRRAKNQAWKYI